MDTYLGIDTSCYTTSLCLVDETYDIAADERIILTVLRAAAACPSRIWSTSTRATCRSSLNGQRRY